MTYTFGGVSFGVATPDGMVPKPSLAVALSIEHIPYSNKDVIWRGGLQTPTFNFPMIVLEANHLAIEALLGSEAVLVYGTYGTVLATLSALNNPRSNFDETHWFYDATFLQTT